MQISLQYQFLTISITALMSQAKGVLSLGASMVKVYAFLWSHLAAFDSPALMMYCTYCWVDWGEPKLTASKAAVLIQGAQHHLKYTTKQVMLLLWQQIQLAHMQGCSKCVRSLASLGFSDNPKAGRRAKSCCSPSWSGSHPHSSQKQTHMGSSTCPIHLCFHETLYRRSMRMCRNPSQSGVTTSTRGSFTCRQQHPFANHWHKLK